MYDELKEEAIVRKVGGRFKLSTLIQKRMVQLNKGSRPLITTNLEDKMAIVLARDHARQNLLGHGCQRRRFRFT